MNKAFKLTIQNTASTIINAQVCFDRIKSEIFNQFDSCIVTAEGKSFPAEEVAVLELLAALDKPLELYNAYEGEREKTPFITITPRPYQYLNELGGLIAALPQDPTQKPFKINGQICTGFNVRTRWEFVVDGKIAVLTHQDMLDAYEHKGDWHTRWTSHDGKAFVNFVFEI